MAACPRCGTEAPADARFCSVCGAPLAAARAREGRKLVTVLFCDLVDSTALAERLDPEAFRALQSRYFTVARAALERHGGTVEKFIGDAVMAVFGVPAVHEDDALRAVRAAVELRDAVMGLGEAFPHADLAVRIGLCSGEVFAGDGESLVSGDPVVTAKRLEEAAPANGVLLASSVHALVRDAVEAERLAAVSLKGKRVPVGAYLLRRLDVLAEGAARRLDLPLVGRTDELASLREAFAAAEVGRECRLVTVLGPAGIGKTRLARELEASEPQARLLFGRCLPYGDGITYWPLVEVVRRAAGLAGGEAAAVARARLGALLDGAADRERIEIGVAAALGLGPEAAAHEVFWSVRRLLEELARERPLVVVVDDLQWGEPAFLDLLEYVVAQSRGSPILLCVLARPEILDRRPRWFSPRPGADTIVLDPLRPAQVTELAANLLGAELAEAAAEQVAAAAAGHPLFAEELVRMLHEEGHLRPDARGRLTIAADTGPLRVPPTVTALLAARLDRLEAEQRLLLERAAVVGERFSSGAVSALAPPELRSSVAAHLQGLVRDELVQPLPSSPGEDDRYKFAHILLCDVAYAALPKSVRAELHERLARYLEDRFAGGIGVDEIAGYHLERAALARHQLDPVDPRGPEIGAEAAARLTGAAHRAAARGDSAAVAGLLERAIALLPRKDSKVPQLLLRRGKALGLAGHLEEADACLRDAESLAAVHDLHAVARRTALERAFLRWYTNPSEGTQALVEAAHEAIEAFEEADAASLARAWLIVAEIHWIQCRLGAMQGALDEALRYADGAERAERERLRSSRARAAMLGPVRVSEALRLCEELAAKSEGDRSQDAMIELFTAYLEALDGRLDEARARAAAARAPLEELGRLILLASQRVFAGQIELLAGDPAAAEALLRDGYRTLEELGEQGNLAGVAAFLAAALHALGRNAEADALLDQIERAGSPDDAEAQVYMRATRARIRAAEGRLAEAEELARSAVAAAEETDAPVLRADALLTLAVALRQAGAAEQADNAARQALAAYEAKGHRVGAAAARAFLAPSEVGVR